MRGVPARLRWAIDRLGLEGGERVLEVGCGRGIAAGLIAEQLDGGHLVASDRSAKMIAAARERNRQHLEAGRLTFVLAEAAELPDLGRYDVGFAVDVNVFGGSCEPELVCLRAQLHRGGAFHFVHRPPVDAKVEQFAENLRAWLPQCGFVVDDVVIGQADGSRILGVRALAV